MLNVLERVWEQQERYNAKVKDRQKRPSAEWMETYILGLVSECGQLLEAMRWKKNRLQLVEEFSSNVPEELADITKYVFSMWILMGYDPYEMLDKVYSKGQLLENLYTQEFETKLKSKVVIFDLDNVLADTQAALAAFFELEHFNPTDLYRSIHLDLAINKRFDEYRSLKNKFETSGGYATIEPLFYTYLLFKDLRLHDIAIVVYTARPVETFKRIRSDTLAWFEDQDVLPDLLKFGRESRITYAAQLHAEGHRVVLVDDDPEIARRATANGIPVIVPQKEYNKEVATIDTNDYRVLVNMIQEKLNEQ